jgi:hypothetical protein
MINLIVILQLLTIVGSRGNVYVLGEAYAFGVIWSFAFKGLAVLVLRFKDKNPREWKVPFNFPLNCTEIPLGLGIITSMIFSVAGINLITKQVATVSGVAFTLVFFVIFLTSEFYNQRRRGAAAHVELDQFKTHLEHSVSSETVAVRPGNTLCLVRDYNTLDHVRKALELTHTGKKDLVVMTVHLHHGPDMGYKDLREEEVFTDYEQLLFSRVVALAEKAGKHVHLLVVPSSDIFQAIVQTAARLDSSEIIAGRSSVMTSAQQARLMGQAWEKLPNRPKHQVCFRVIDPDGKIHDYYLGAHEPRLTQQEVDFIHQLWLELARDGGAGEIHHRDIVTLALTRLERELHGTNRKLVLDEIYGEMQQRA